MGVLRVSPVTKIQEKGFAAAMRQTLFSF